MNTKSVEKLNNRNGLFKTYSWFEKTFSPVLKNDLQEFWGNDFELNLISVSEDESFFLGGSEYFATRIKLSKTEQFVIRLSKEAVKLFLDKSLGETRSFEFENITELEGKIITAFNNSVYKNCQNILNKTTEEDIDGDYHLVFLVKNNISENMPKIVLTVPKAYINSEEIFPSDDRFSIKDFPTTKVSIDLYLGKTTLPLNDIKNLEKEDIIVLENSNINDMTLIFQNNEIGFKVSPDPSLIINFDEDNGGENMSETQNIWDNIQVDISAEFEQVKISLGEIKQISEGLVIDMGSIYENKVHLKVENKTIANGELVIINDRYGVRIDEVIEDRQEETPQPQKQPAVNEQPKAVEQPVENNQEETETPQTPQEGENGEFNYNDFDVEDENI